MAAAPVYRPTIIKTVYSQLKLKRIQGGWDKFCKASGVRSTQQGSKEARKQGSKEARKHGSMEAWKHGSMEAWKQGSKEARKQGRIISSERYF